MVRPQDSDLTTEADEQQRYSTEKSGFSESNISEWQEVESYYSSNSSFNVDSQVTTSAEKSHNQTESRMRSKKRRIRAIRK